MFQPMIEAGRKRLPEAQHPRGPRGRKIIEDWKIDYSTERPHSSLKHQNPEEFAAARPFDKTQWVQQLELRDGSAPAPIAHAAE